MLLLCVFWRTAGGISASKLDAAEVVKSDSPGLAAFSLTSALPEAH